MILNPCKSIQWRRCLLMAALLLPAPPLTAQIPNPDHNPELDPVTVRDMELTPIGSDSEYELGIGDRIRLIVVNHEDLSGEFVLDGKGQFYMPLIETVDARDLNPAELEARLVDLLKPDYLVNPRVTIQVLKYQPYYLMGEVASRGAFPYLSDMTYLKAIAIAGGFTYRAKQDHVYVIRGDDPELVEIKLEIKEKVQPGDIIRVAERLF